MGGGAPSVFSSETANRAREVLDVAAVDQTVPRPRIGDWWQELMRRVASFFARLFNVESETMVMVLRVGAWAVIVSAGLALLWLVWKWWRRGVGAGEEQQLRWIDPHRGKGPLHAGSWTQHLDDALRRGEVGAALEALWFVVACRLGATGNEAPSAGGSEVGAADGARPIAARALDPGWSDSREWTGRRLLAAAGHLRGALAPTVLRMERITYGSGVASMEDIVALRRAVDEVLPDPAASGGS